MKKRRLALVGMVMMLLCGCGQTDVDSQSGQEASTESSVEISSEPSTEEASSVDANGADSTEAPAEELWVPAEAPAVRNTISDEEKQQQQQAILEKGTFLYSGETNNGYYPSDVSWLQSASENDVIALIYACDDVTHGGWGVLGFDTNVGGSHTKLMDVLAMSDQPDKERLVV